MFFAKNEALIETKDIWLIETDGKENVTQYSYDKLGRKVKEEKPNDLVIELIYDEKGNLVKTTNNAGTETRVVDEFNRLIEVVDVNGNHTHYEMDSFDNQTKIVNADGTVITKEYNERQQLVTVNRNNHLEASYLYDSYGNVSSITQGNGVVVTITNDIYGRILTKETKLNGTVIEGFKFTYDPENNLLSEEITTPTERYTNTYTYDENNELKTSSKMIDGQRVEIEYNYSVFGNRIQKSRSGDVSYTYNEKNQLTSMTTKDGETKYYYDGNGSVRSSIDPTGLVTNTTYDGFNRLIEVNRGKMRITYTYDGNGNRISETVQDTTVIHNSWSETLYENYTVNQLKGIISKKKNDELFEAMRQQVNAINKNKGCRLISKKQVEEMEIMTSSSTTTFAPQTTFFVNDVTSEYTEVLVEKNPSSTSTYSYGKERISDGTNYYQTSRNATVSSTTSQAGEQLETYQYTDYGLEQTPGYGYNGERRDITGLIYLRNRTYDSSTGRFLQLDTYLGEKDSIITQNRSLAFNNNPYKYVDRGGNMAISLGSGGGKKEPPKNVCLVPPPEPKKVEACKFEPGDSKNGIPPRVTYNGIDVNEFRVEKPKICPPNFNFGTDYGKISNSFVTTVLEETFVSSIVNTMKNSIKFNNPISAYATARISGGVGSSGYTGFVDDILGVFSKGAPLIGFAVDYSIQKYQGVDTNEALIKAGGHSLISIAIIGSTSLVGAPLFVTIFVASTAFDLVYDNREAISKTLSDVADAFKGFVNDSIEWIGNLF